MKWVYYWLTILGSLSTIALRYYNWVSSKHICIRRSVDVDSISEYVVLYLWESHANVN